MALNGIIIVDKPADITSHGVVSRLRRILSTKKVGHGGTLDPMATGVLPIFIGRATRASSMLLNSDKAYTAGFILGLTTDTQDTSGTILTRSDFIPDEMMVRQTLPAFVGHQKQTPPMYSAIKIDGKKLYELAREGKEIERPVRDIEIYQINYLGYLNGEYKIHISCSKGTYIRTLIHDIGAFLGCGAVLSSLRRTDTGSFSEKDSVKLDDIEIAVERGDFSFLRPVDSIFMTYNPITIDESGERLCRVGALVPVKDLKTGEMYRVYSQNGSFLMVAAAVTEKNISYLKTVKNFFDVE